MPVMVPALMALYFCGTGWQVKQYIVYNKYYIYYDWDIHHGLCETGRALSSGRPPILTQTWAKTRQMDIIIISLLK